MVADSPITRDGAEAEELGLGAMGRLVQSLALRISRRDALRRVLAVGVIALAVAPLQPVEANHTGSCGSGCCTCGSACSYPGPCSGTCCSQNNQFCYECCCSCDCSWGCCDTWRAFETVCDDGSHGCTCNRC